MPQRNSYRFQKKYDHTDGMCVYCIENTINGKVYIGITSGFIRERMYSHFRDLRSNCHGNIHLQRAFVEYGEENFKCYNLYNNCASTEYLAVLESFFCDLYQANHRDFGYNIKEPGFIKEKSKANIKFNTPVIRYPEERRKAYSERMKANNHFTGFRHSDEMIQIIIQKRLAKWEKYGNPNTGRKMSPEQCEKHGKAMKGLLAGSKNPASRHVIAYDIGSQKQYSFPTVLDAANHFGLHKCTINRISGFKKQTKTGLRFMKP